MKRGSETEKLNRQAEEAAQLLRGLAHPTRLRVLCLLHEGERTVGELVELLPEISQPLLSQHLATLRNEGVVTAKVRGSERVYMLTMPAVVAVMSALALHFCACRNVAKP